MALRRKHVKKDDVGLKVNPAVNYSYRVFGGEKDFLQ